MTRDDIDRIAQCLVALKASVGQTFTDDELERMIDRFLWAIHSSESTLSFSEQRFRARIHGQTDVENI